jgi:polyvinyl alcohol dehydrogenase (cytochrome)
MVTVPAQAPPAPGLSPGAVTASSQAPSGEAVYKTHCAACHDPITPRVPSRDALRKMPAARILRSLDGGAMMTVAFTMTREERLAVSSYLGTPDALSGPPPSAYCTNRTIRLAASPANGWNGWSPGTGSTRFQPAAAAGMSARA